MTKKILLLILALGFYLRLVSIDNNHVFFYFDQARDATISRQIIEQKDLKVMGPSVSGTNDSVYHGVLYYYLISPIYLLGKGNPYFVAVFLSMIGTLGIGITYKLGKVIFESEKIGLLAAFLSSISTISIHQSTWLSNPSLSGFFVPLTYYFIWMIFFSNKKQGLVQYILLGVSLACSMQSALQNVTIFGSLLIAIIYSFKNQKHIFNFKNAFALMITFLFGISSMIVTELLMFKRGILSFETLNLAQHSVNIAQIFQQITKRYYSLFIDILNPSRLYTLFSFLTTLAIIFVGKINKKQVLWSLSFIFAPVWLLIWHYRDPNHTFIGIEVIIFLLLANGLVKLLDSNILKKTLALLFLFSFAYLNINQMIEWRNQQFQYFGIQKGAFLSNQLALIDKSYELSNDEQFSFSSLTSPYAINTTWNYLYKWYGNQKYGYLPNFIGINQNNFVGNNILDEIANPSTMHYSVIEPDTTLSQEFQDTFLIEQEKLFEEKPSTDIYNFGTLTLKRLDYEK